MPSVMLHLFPYFGMYFCLLLSFFSALKLLKGLTSERWDQLFYKRKEQPHAPKLVENTMETTDGNPLCTTGGFWWAPS